MASSVLLGKRLRRQIRAKVWPVLEEAGFVEFAPLRAHRVVEGRIDTVEFVTVRPEWREARWLGGEAYGNGATFSLHVGTYYHDGPEVPALRPRAQECHRAVRLAHESMESAADGRTFYPGRKGERMEEVVDQAVRALQARGLDILRHYASRDAAHPGPYEEVGLSREEADEMMRICRGGLACRTSAMAGLHRRLHLADEHVVRAA